MYGGTVSGGMSEGNHGTESPSLRGAGPLPPGASEAQSSKMQNTGEARPSRGCTRGRAGEAPWEGSSFPTRPGQGAGSHLVLWFAARFLKNLAECPFLLRHLVMLEMYAFGRLESETGKFEETAGPSRLLCLVREEKLGNLPTVTQQQSLDVRSLQTFFGPSFPSQGTEGGGFSDETPAPPTPLPPHHPPPPPGAKVPSERWMHVCWLSLRKKPSLQRHS